MMSYPPQGYGAAGIPWIKQMLSPMIIEDAAMSVVLHPARLGNLDVCNGAMKMPIDFTVMNNLYLVMYSTTTIVRNIRVQVFFGQCGELFNTHTGDLTPGIAMVANTFLCYDLVTLFPALLGLLAADDNMYVRVTNQSAGTVNIYWLDGRYS